MEVSTNKIISLKANIPELEGTENNVLQLYLDLDKVNDEIWELRKQIHVLENKKEGFVEKLKLLSPLYDRQYETKEVKEIKNEVNMQIINDSDYRNHD